MNARKNEKVKKTKEREGGRREEETRDENEWPAIQGKVSNGE